MRVLHEDDLRWITGGACDSNAYHTESCGESDCTRVEQVVVTAHVHTDGCCGSESPYPDASDEPENPPEDEDPFYEDDEEEPDEPPAPPTLPVDPLAENRNPVWGLSAPDGAIYYLPAGVDAAYLTAAVAHLRSIPDPLEKLFAFNEMYTNRDHPHYIDFKDWGTGNGPPGTVGGGPLSYESEALGREYESLSAYEAFGNFFYGLAGVAGGIDPDAVVLFAGLKQEGGYGVDAPEDVPHVNYGMSKGHLYNDQPFTVFIVGSQ